jgi:hypothetical protein
MAGKLGKNPPKPNYKSIPFHHFRGTDPLPPVPEKVYWEYKLDLSNLRMFKNDTVGCCTVAAIAHMIMNMTAHTGTIVVPTDDQVIEFYSAVSGYDPAQTDAQGNNPTDVGAAITDVLNRWQTVGLAGHQILGWTEFNHADDNTFGLVEWLFGGVDAGVQLPASAMTQFDAGQDWDLLINDGGNVGGHSVPYFGLGALGRRLVTWKKLIAALNAWNTQYVDEGYGIISQDWFDRVDVAPNHFKKDDLWKYLKSLPS